MPPHLATIPQPDDQDDLAALKGVTDTLESWAGSTVTVSIADGETKWYMASFAGTLAGLGIDEQSIDLLFEDDRVKLRIYGDLTDSTFVKDDLIQIEYRGGDIEILKVESGPIAGG